MTAPYATSPIAHRQNLAAGDDLRIEAGPPAALHILRGTHEVIAPVCEQALGLGLPGTVGGIGTTGDLRALWLAPDEWLLVSPPGKAARQTSDLASVLSGTHHLLTDVSDYYVGIDISGARARDALAKLMVIDLHPRALALGSVLATVCAKSSVWLWTDPGSAGEEHFRIFVRRSHADYLWCLLAEAGREWGLPEQTPAGQVRLHLPHFD